MDLPSAVRAEGRVSSLRLRPLPPAVDIAPVKPFRRLPPGADVPIVLISIFSSAFDDD